MPDQRGFQKNVDQIGEGMWRLKIDDGNRDGSGSGSGSSPYPDRPGVEDCMYYMRNGVCGYGGNCRYNHPTFNGQGQVELPERDGQPDCQFFLKTGTCKFGSACKFNHPRGYDIQHAPLNTLGLPMRQDKMSCPYYLKTGACKFGIACKFDHPEPATMQAVYPMTGPPAQGPIVSSVQPPLSSFPLHVLPWPSTRPHYVNSPRIQGFPAYMPFMPIQQGWSYMGSVSQLPHMQTTITNLHAQLGSNAIVNLPERPNQPECLYYLKNGSCKYGANCKYNHPKQKYLETPFTLGPLALPPRPGHAVCTFYKAYGNCSHSSACNYDHPPYGYYNYAVPTLAMQDPSAQFYPNPRSLQQGTWTSEKSPKLSHANNAEENVHTNHNNEG